MSKITKLGDAAVPGRVPSLLYFSPIHVDNVIKIVQLVDEFLVYGIHGIRSAPSRGLFLIMNDLLLFKICCEIILLKYLKIDNRNFMLRM